MPDEPTYSLFIIHAPEDEAWVQSYLIPAVGLPAERLILSSRFRLGASRAEELQRAVENSRFTLLILTPEFFEDPWARKAEELADYLATLDQMDRMIPLNLKPSKKSLRIALRVGLDCTNPDNWDGEVERLRDQFEPGVAQPAEEPDLPPPYPGMRPFEKDDARYFYGRTAEIKLMLETLRWQKFVLVIGASGSGKSSLIRAGLLPKLADAPEFREQRWLVPDPIRPGTAPLQSLAAGLGITFPPPNEPRDAGAATGPAAELGKAELEAIDLGVDALLKSRERATCCSRSTSLKRCSPRAIEPSRNGLSRRSSGCASTGRPRWSSQCGPTSMTTCCRATCRRSSRASASTWDH